MTEQSRTVAVLGPTNTGKTHLAIETMLSFDTGMIGFPLRLLAREVYDKIIKKISIDKVALITGGGYGGDSSSGEDNIPANLAFQQFVQNFQLERPHLDV